MFFLNGSIVIQKLSNQCVDFESCCVQLLFFVEVDDGIPLAPQDVQLKVESMRNPVRAWKYSTFIMNLKYFDAHNAHRALTVAFISECQSMVYTVSNCLRTYIINRTTRRRISMK